MSTKRIVPLASRPISVNKIEQTEIGLPTLPGTQYRGLELSKIEIFYLEFFVLGLEFFYKNIFSNVTFNKLCSISFHKQS